MTFTKTPPTTPGFYAWRYSIATIVHLADVFKHTETDELMAAIAGHTYDVKDKGGEWCRLVPAEEVEKAWDEAFSAGCYAARITHITAKGSFEESRAKQVAEGTL